MIAQRNSSQETQWISLPGVKKSESVVAGYTLKFDVSSPRSTKVEVAADQQYALYLDGEFIGRGNESGTPDYWYVDSYQLELAKGSHILAVMVWSWGGPHSAMAQMEVFHGLHLTSNEKASRQMLGTGLAPWKVRRLPGISFTEHLILPHGWTGVPPSQTLKAKDFPWNWTIGAGEAWKTPSRVKENPGAYHHLRPSKLPPPFSAPISGYRVRFVSDQIEKNVVLRQRDDLKNEHATFETLAQGQPIILPAHTKRKVLFDLENYYCAHPTITTSGGKEGRIRLTWAEALFEGAESMKKGSRDEVLNQYMRGIWDEFRPDGDTVRNFIPLTWRAGRYLEVTIESGTEPLKLELRLQETRFDLPALGHFSCDNTKVNEIFPISLRSLQTSSHDNFVDCPFYERLLYSGDGRLEALTAYTISGDDLLARKAIELFGSSAKANGLCMSRWPSRQVQYIPTFALWWVGMVYDFSMWRDDRRFVRSLMPAVRSTLDYFLTRLNEFGIYAEKEAVWNFVDWVPDWKEHPDGGVPPSGKGVNMLVNCILKYILSLAAKLERYAGSAARARHYELIATKMGRSLHQAFWDQSRKLYRDEASGRWFSEHTQIMTILGGFVGPREGHRILETMAPQKKVARVSLFFTNYLFEAAFLSGREDIFFDRLKAWNGFMAKGFKTVPENFADTRSDCHGWGAHPLYHLVANVAGIRPASPGFRSVLIAPQPGLLKKIEASCPHPQGAITVRYRLSQSRFTAELELPPGLSGEFVLGHHRVKVKSGRQTLRLPFSRSTKIASK